MNLYPTLKAKESYQSKVRRHQDKISDAGTIAQDVSRTFPEREGFNNSNNLDALRRILVVISEELPSNIGYFQGMNFVAGNVQISMKNKEEAIYWSLY